MNKPIENEILRLTQKGHTQNQISEELKISRSTVCRALKKMNIRTKPKNVLTENLSDFLRVYYSLNCEIQEVMEYYKCSERTVYYALKKAKEQGFDLESHRGLETSIKAAPYARSEKTKRYLLTCAQNNTHVETKTWSVLQKIAEFYKAEIYVSTFTYSHNRTYDVKNGKRVKQEDNWWDSRIVPYVRDTFEHLAPDLVWCGNMNTLPTAKNPLNGWDSYAGDNSGVYPHPKIQMKSVPTAKNKLAKINYTTGAVTKRNYIHKRAGIHADFHHSFGALLVEVAPNGEWFARQINVDKNGTAHDLNNRFHHQEGHSYSDIEAVVFGDIHVAKLDSSVWKGAFEQDASILRKLKPKWVFLHDLLDFESASHHNKKDPLHQLFLKETGKNKVLIELKNTAEFLKNLIELGSPHTTPVVVNSNHDQHLLRWVKETDWRSDLENAELLLELQLCCVREIKKAAKKKEYGNLELLPLCLRTFSSVNGKAVFLKEDDSFELHGIEFAYHGDKGANGARGNFLGFANMGAKVCIGHSHSAGIFESVYVAGVSGKLDMGYNKGASSWSHSHILLYPNGKRAIVTMRKDKWCL